MIRPTIARPTQGLYVGTPRTQSSPHRENFWLQKQHPNSKHRDFHHRELPVSPLEMKFSEQSAKGTPKPLKNATYIGGGTFLPSPNEEFVACELDRLADEANVDDILAHGFLNGNSCLRLSLSPRGVLRDSICDFNNININQQGQNSLMDLFKRNKNPRGALIITSDD